MTEQEIRDKIAAEIEQLSCKCADDLCGEKYIINEVLAIVKGDHEQ